MAETPCSASIVAGCAALVLRYAAMLCFSSVRSDLSAQNVRLGRLRVLHGKRLLPPIAFAYSTDRLAGWCRIAISVDKFCLQAHCTVAAVTKRTPCQVPLC